MNRKIFFAIIFIFSLFFLFVGVLWAGKFFYIQWFFVPDSTWMWWHPGKVQFDIWVNNSGSRAGIDVAWYLSGNFWLGNVGWATFSHGRSDARAQILCTDEVFRNPGLICPATGFAWSQNAGWIMLSGATIDGGSGVYYDPSEALIKWFWYSQALGWIPFFAHANDVVIASPVTTTSQTGIMLNGVWLNFIWKMAIIGSIAGSRIYNLPNQQIGYVFSDINHSDFLNSIQKNISLLTRNVNILDLSDPYPNAFNFMMTSGDLDTSISWAWPATKDSIIVVGWDVFLDQEYIGDISSTHPRSLIVLKDKNGNGGNVIISEKVKRIYALIYAEWVVYSWIKNAGVITSYIDGGAWNIPQQQLYIHWAIISKNTIGGAMQNPPTCPVVLTECTDITAQKYDLNYFRTYNPSDPTQKSIPYDDVRLNNASVIIEYDTRLIDNPPPGLEKILQ